MQKVIGTIQVLLMYSVVFYSLCILVTFAPNKGKALPIINYEVFYVSLHLLFVGVLALFIWFALDNIKTNLHTNNTQES